LAASVVPLDDFIRTLRERPPVRVPGTAVFMTARAEGIPPILVHHLRHDKALHQHTVLLSVVVLDVPQADRDTAIEVHALDAGLQRVIVRFGFMQQPNVPAALEQARLQGLILDPSDTTYYLAHLTLFSNDRIGMSGWRDKLFIFMSRNARRATN